MTAGLNGGWLRVEPLASAGDLRSWLTRVWPFGAAWLLARADDGVIWGMIANGELRVGGDERPGEVRPLRRETVQDLKVFSPEGELRLWRRDAELRAALVTTADAPPGQHFVTAEDRSFPLLGSPDNGQQPGSFSRYRGGAGQQHFVPVFDLPPLWLDARFYYAATDSGVLRMFEYRLLSLSGQGDQR